MGSFNTSCMVTQQVIVPNAEAVIIPIIQQSSYRPVEIVKNGIEYSQFGFANTTCYPTAFWGYADPIIRGKYYDYGCFELSNTEENRINLISFYNYLHIYACKTKQGENKDHDDPFDMTTLYDPMKDYVFGELESIWNKVWNVVQENRVFVDNYNSTPRNLQFAVMHRAAADYLIDYVNKSTTYDGKSYEQKSYFKAYIKACIKAYTDKYGKFFETEDSDMLSFFFASQIARLARFHIGDQEGSYISNYYDNSSYSINDIFVKFKNKPELNDESIDELITELFNTLKSQIDHRYIHVGLDWMNIKLSPMVYASQDYDNSTGKDYAKMIRSVSSQINKEIKADND